MSLRRWQVPRSSVGRASDRTMLRSVVRDQILARGILSFCFFFGFLIIFLSFLIVGLWCPHLLIHIWFIIKQIAWFCPRCEIDVMHRKKFLVVPWSGIKSWSGESCHFCFFFWLGLFFCSAKETWNMSLRLSLWYWQVCHLSTSNSGAENFVFLFLFWFFLSYFFLADNRSLMSWYTDTHIIYHRIDCMLLLKKQNRSNALVYKKKILLKRNSK